MLLRFNEDTKTYQLFRALKDGQAVSADQARERYGIKNISAEVCRIRQAGFAVFANARTTKQGTRVTEYVMGKPSRRVVAAGYRALAKGLV